MINPSDKIIDSPQVSITTILYNSADSIGDCLSSIRNDVEDGLAEVIVVDNQSPDNSAEIVRRKFPFAKLIESEKNLGFSGGCNLGWKYCQGRYWLLLNPDTVVPENGLKQFVEWMDAHPEYGAASASMIDEDGVVCDISRSFPSIWLSLLELTRLHLLLPVKVRGKLLRGSYKTESDQSDAGWIPGTVMLVRREVIEKVGLLSEKIFMYGEDIEWCWRIKKAGWKIGVCRDVKVIHKGSTSATYTWGSAEVDLRIQRGIYHAAELMHSKLYSKILMITDSILYFIEAHHPSRNANQKESAQKYLRINSFILKNKK